MTAATPTDERTAVPDPDPPYLYPEYVATRTRAPRKPMVLLPHALTELTGPALGTDRVTAGDADLTARGRRGAAGRADHRPRPRAGQRRRRPVRNALVEVWQANAAGRYRHEVDQHPAPLDPNFDGRRALPHRRPGPLPVRDHQAGPVPVAEPPQRLARVRTSTSRSSATRSCSAWSRRCTSRATRCSPRTRSSCRCRIRAAATGWSRAWTWPSRFPSGRWPIRWDIVLRGREQTPAEDPATDQ